LQRGARPPIFDEYIKIWGDIGDHLSSSRITKQRKLHIFYKCFKPFHRDANRFPSLISLIMWARAPATLRLLFKTTRPGGQAGTPEGRLLIHGLGYPRPFFRPLAQGIEFDVQGRCDGFHSLDPCRAVDHTLLSVDSQFPTKLFKR